MKARLIAAAASVALLLATGCLGDPVENPDAPQDTVAFAGVEVGASHVCAWTGTGRAYCWGSNGVAQLATGDFDDRFVHVPAVQGGNVFVGVSPGGGHSCAATTTNAAYCWGVNEWGQGGFGSRGPPNPQARRVITDVDLAHVVTGGAHSCGLDLDGRAWCWGHGERGRLGNGLNSLQEYRDQPDSVRTDESFTVMALGGFHSCALTGAGAAYCWGAGGDGQVGTGAAGNVDYPTEVVGGHVFTQIDAGGYHTCAVKANGEAYCWGANGFGQLGIGSGGSQTSPALVAGGLTFKSISAGGFHTCGVTTDDIGYCWGVNDDGRVGDGTTGTRGTPGAVEGNLRFRSISAGIGEVFTASCGITTGGLVYCWGYGVEGMMGDGRGVDSPVPVMVAGQIGG